MKSTLVDIRALAERFEELAREVAEAWKASAQVPGGIDPEQLRLAMQDLEDVLLSAGGNPEPPRLTEKEIRALGDRGTKLCVMLSRQACTLGLDDAASELEALPWSFALWVIRHGGEISELDPLLQALAANANRLESPDHLAHLYAEIDEVLNALCPSIEEQIEAGNAPPAWRNLLINRAIVATRSYQPALMREAFDSILDQIPEDAPRFFEEGMREMSLLRYPKPVREVIASYFHKFGTRMMLH